MKLWGVIVVLAGATALGAPGEPSKTNRAGQELAADIRSRAPKSASEHTGKLKIRDGLNRRHEVPVKLTIQPGDQEWRATYETPGTALLPAEKLVVIHRPQSTNSYLFARASAPGKEVGALEPVAPLDIFASFAGSDFAFADLGLDFFHWAGQRFVKAEMRRSVSCRMIESVPAIVAAKGYGKVSSWLDSENGDVVMAKAHDHDGAVLKEFNVIGLKKVNGTWELKEIEMRNVMQDSVTRLEFDLSSANSLKK